MSLKSYPICIFLILPVGKASCLYLLGVCIEELRAGSGREQVGRVDPPPELARFPQADWQPSLVAILARPCVSLRSPLSANPSSYVLALIPM